MVINELRPDFIVFQEAEQDSTRHDMTQVSAIADACGFRHSTFTPTYTKQDGIVHGLGIISRHPIISTDSHALPLHPEHNEPASALFCQLEVNGHPITICNVHFSNSDSAAELQLIALIDICKQQQAQPIIAGDFNIFNLDQYLESHLEGYQSSHQVQPYISIPKNTGTLDYITVPTNKYVIAEVICPDAYLSDHRAVVADISPV